MSGVSPIIDNFKDKIGVEWELGMFEVERGMIQRFARAIGDPNPLWHDEEYAGQSKHGGIVAPPTFVVTIGGEQLGQVISSFFHDGLLHGSTELECYQTIRPGDRITVTARLTDVRERQGRRAGKMAFVTFDITYTNQRHEPVSRCQQTMIGYETEAAKHD